MAIRWMDGFDYLQAGDVARRYDSSSIVQSLVTGRNGLGKAVCPNLNTYLVKSIPDNQATLITGMSMYWPSVGSGSGLFFAFTDNQGSLASVGTQLELWGGGGQTYVSVKANGVEIGRTSSTITYDTWHWLELKATFAPTGGTWEIRLNELVIGSGTGNTSTTGNSYANGWWLSVVGSTTSYYDDWVILDTTGPAPYNDYLGDCVIECLLPAGPGAHTDFTSSNSNPDWQNVDDVPQDGDTSYVVSNVVGAMDTYVPSTIAAGGSTMAMQVVATARRADVGAHNAAVVVRSAGTDVVSSNLFAPTVEYLCYSDIFLTDSLGALWQAGTIQTAEFGIKVVD